MTPFGPPLDPLAMSPHGVRGAVPYYIWVYTPYGYRGLYGYICMYMYIHVYTYMYIYIYVCVHIYVDVQSAQHLFMSCHVIKLDDHHFGHDAIS